MRDREPTVRTRELGDALRAAMEMAGLNGHELALRLGWSDSRVSRLLSGKRGGSETDVVAFLTACGVKSSECDRLVKLSREGNVSGWFQQYGPRLPKQVRTLIDHEDKALTIVQFQSTWVPGLLQIGDYARALIQGAGTVPPDEVDDRVAARLARQNLFSRIRPPKFTFYLHEFALRMPVGGSEVMSDQLHHLLRMSVRKYLSLRIVPVAIGVHAASAGPFTLLDVADFKPVVYLDSETSCLFLEDPVEIGAYQRILDLLADTSLDEGQSRDMIAALATRLYADREGHDDA
ncbi:helix-turn-helix domain-containing protein [Actinokineospora sp.]|uniref:helix-turn-helix domain-containing protein n=1 Tax=Actinokineospora sp. TaxID=1872133 RepID=UPI004037C6D1